MDFLESALIGGGGEGATIILVLFFMLAIAETEVRFFSFLVGLALTLSI